MYRSPVDDPLRAQQFSSNFLLPERVISYPASFLTFTFMRVGGGNGGGFGGGGDGGGGVLGGGGGGLGGGGGQLPTAVHGAGGGDADGGGGGLGGGGLGHTLIWRMAYSLSLFLPFPR